MELINIGDRIAFATKLNVPMRICYLLGYGIYLGKFIPTEDEINNITNKKKRKIAKGITTEACKFKLDDGAIVWQWDGWFMAESRFKEVFINDCYKEDWIVKNIDIYSRRRKV